TLERSIYLAAHKQIKEQFDPDNDPALVAAQHGWHPGVIGIVAGKLAEKYHRPVVLIAWDEMGVKPGSASGGTVPALTCTAPWRPAAPTWSAMAATRPRPCCPSRSAAWKGSARTSANTWLRSGARSIAWPRCASTPRCS